MQGGTRFRGLAATMVMTMGLLRTGVFGSELAADGLTAQGDGELIGLCCGGVGQVAVEATVAPDANDALLQVAGIGVGWGAAIKRERIP